MTPESNWVLLIARMLFGLLAIGAGVLGLYWWSTTEQPRRARPSSAMRWLAVPTALVAVAHIVALGAAMRGNVGAASAAEYLGTAMMALLFLFMSGVALQFRRQGRRPVEE